MRNTKLVPFPMEHSLKCITIAPRKKYLVSLFHFTNDFIQKMRWRVYHHEKALESRLHSGGITNDDDTPDVVPNKKYFPTRYSAPPNNKISAFESDLYNLINNVEFREVHSKFQRDLSIDVKRIRGSPNVIVSADKTNNLYEICPNEYNKLLRNNITRDYRLCDSSIISSLNDEA